MDILKMIKFQIKLMIKTPIIVIYFFVCPVLLAGIIGYLTEGSFGAEMSSYEFYSISMMAFIYIGSGIVSSFNFIEKTVKAGNFRLIFTPASTSSIYSSQVISTTILAGASTIVSMLVFSGIFNVNYNGSGLYIFMAFTTLAFLSSGIGIFLCTIFEDAGIINLVFNVIQTIFCALGGAFFSIEALGEIPALIAKISPVKWLMDGILYSMYDNSSTLLYIIVVLNIILGILILGICKITFKTEKYIV